MNRRTVEDLMESLRSEPYRILFPLAVLGGVSGIVHWLLFATGRPSAGVSLHIALQIPAYMGLAGGGFLATALPRLTRTEMATRAEFACLLLFSAGLLLAPFTRELSPTGEIFAGYLLFLAVFAGRRVRRAENPVPPTLRWVFVAFALAGAGAVLLHIRPVLATRLLSQGFVFPLVLGVAPFVGRMILGRSGGLRCGQGTSPRIGKIFPVVVGLFIASFVVESWETEPALRVAYLLRGGIVLLVFAKAGLLAPPTPLHPQSVGFWISILLTAAGPIAAAIDPARRITWLHLTFLGGFSLMFLMVATRVALVHGGRGELLERPFLPAAGYGGAIFFATFARIGADLVPSLYFLGIGTAATLWILAHLIFAVTLLTACRSPID